MRRHLAGLLLCAAGCRHVVDVDVSAPMRWEPMPDLPVARSNNAVATIDDHGSAVLVSALGLSSEKRWSDVSSDAWQLDFRTGRWLQLADVPGAGRLASAAVGWHERVYVVGGYTVAEDGTEVTVPSVDVWSVETGRWTRGPQMPVPVDDAVAALWRERWIVVVSGWSNDGNIADVQLYDILESTWIEGTPVVGAPVFGHAGAMIDDTLVYCGGVRVVPGSDAEKRSFAPHAGCYRGDFEDAHGTIAWTQLPPHLGQSRYRMAAGAIKGRIVFAGGTDNPYNYDGIGYDGRPSTPVRDVFAWNLEEGRWEELPPLPEPSMDHRSLAVFDGDLVLVGGMDAQRRPTTRVWRLTGL